MQGAQQMSPRASSGRDDEMVIVGAGLVGTVLAMYLARQGHRVAIYERRRNPTHISPEQGRSLNLTLSARGYRTLRELGIDEQVREISMPLRGRMIHAEGGGAHFQPYTEAGQAIYSISRSTLNLALLGLAWRSPAIKIHFDHRCVGVNLERRTVFVERAEGGTLHEVPAQALFAADGVGSGARRSLLDRPGFDFYQKHWSVQRKELTIPPRNGDWALDKSALHLWPRGDHMLIALPNLDRSMTVSLFLPSGGEPSFESINTPAALLAFFERTCGDLIPLMPGLVRDYFSRPPSSLTTTRCAPWVHDGWLTLIGSAAHSMVPFLGQGTNCGLEDCAVLAACLRSHERLPDALAEFERRRRADCDAVTELSERHYTELARRAQDPLFVVEKALEQRLFRMAPDHFIPLYNMVAFLDTPYREIDGRARQQQALLAELMAIPRIEELSSAPEVQQEIRWRLDRFLGRRALLTGTSS